MTFEIGLVAGEASGDLLGGDLLREIRALHPDAKFVGVGGPAMQEQGLKALAPMAELEVFGLWEPLRRLPRLLALRRRLFREFRRRRIQAFVGIDAPSFNTGLELRLRRVGVPTAHYVGPSIWAWRPGRIHTLVKALDLMLCLFPFELPAYEKAGLRALCVGHPLARRVPMQPDRRAAREALGLAPPPGQPDGPWIALLPGSRPGELRRHLPMLGAAAALLESRIPGARFLWPLASPGQAQQARQAFPHLARRPARHHFLDRGGAGPALAAADYALVCSGTATLEAALHKVPMVSFYRLDRFTYYLFSKLMRAPDFVLANLLAGRSLVPAFLQDAATPRALADALDGLVSADNADMVAAFAEIHQQLDLGGGALAAREILQLAGIDAPPLPEKPDEKPGGESAESPAKPPGPGSGGGLAAR